jgi:chromosome segregation ATPase
MVNSVFSGPQSGGILRQQSVADILKQRSADAATPGRTGSTDAGDALLGALKKAGATNTEALEEKLAEHKETQAGLEALQRQSDPSEARKARAKQKIAEIKEQLKQLRMLAAINPEAAARQAARLSRELSAAVKEYASAGGDAAAVSGGGTPGSTAPSSTTAQPAAGEAQQAGGTAASNAAAPTQAGTGETGTNTASQQPSVPGETGQAGETPEAEGQAGTAAASAADANTAAASAADADTAEDTHPDREGADAYRDLAAEQEKQLAAKSSEDEFLNSIKQLKAELESILKRGEAARDDDTGNSRDADDIRKGLRALDDVDQALLAISSPTSASLGAIDIIA